MTHFPRFPDLLALFLFGSSSALQGVEITVDASSEGPVLNYNMGRVHNMANATSPEGPQDEVLLRKLEPNIIRVRLKLEEYYDPATQQIDLSGEYAYFDQAHKLAEELLLMVDGDDEVRKGELSLAEVKAANKAAIRELKARYPKIRYIGATNEADHGNPALGFGQGPQAVPQFYPIWRVFMEAVRELNEEENYHPPLLVGAPSTTKINAFVGDFLETYMEDPDPDKQLDILIYHEYGVDESPAAILNHRNTALNYMASAGMEPLPIWIGESGIFAGAQTKGSLEEDQLRKAAGMAAQGKIYMLGGADLAIHWVNEHPSNHRKDLFDYTTDGIPTPFYNMCLMQTWLHEQSIEALSSGANSDGTGIDALATTSGKEVAVMAWHYRWEDGGSAVQTAISVNDLPAVFEQNKVRVALYLIDDQQANFNAGREKAALEPILLKVIPGTGSYETSITLKPNSVAFLRLQAVETGASLLPAPGDLVAEAETRESVSLSWAPVPDALAYEISWGTHAGVRPNFVGVGLANSTVIHDVPVDGKPAYFAIRSLSKAGWGDWSSEVSAEFEVTVLEETTIDNTDSTGVSLIGDWSTSTTKPNYYGTNYAFHDGQGNSAGNAKVRYSPDLDEVGEYRISVWLPDGDANRVIDAPFVITHADGVTSVDVNQQAPGGSWVVLGDFMLDPADIPHVEITDEGTGRYTIADAVRFELLERPQASEGLLQDLPPAIAAEAGQPVVLSVLYQGTTGTQYTWFHNGDAVPGVSGPVLVFDPVLPEHEGEYRVRVDPPFSASVHSGNCELSVNTDFERWISATPLPEDQKSIGDDWDQDSFPNIHEYLLHLDVSCRDPILGTIQLVHYSDRTSEWIIPRVRESAAHALEVGLTTDLQEWTWRLASNLPGVPVPGMLNTREIRVQNPDEKTGFLMLRTRYENRR